MFESTELKFGLCWSVFLFKACGQGGCKCLSMEEEDGILGKLTSKGRVYVRGFQGCFGILGIGCGPRGALTS